MRRTALFLSLVLMGVFTASGCHRTAPINNPTSVSGYKKLTQAQVREAIYAACLGNRKWKWAARDISSNTIEATVRVRRHTAVVDIIYSPNEYTIRYKSSDNLGAQNGNIHPNYNSWVKNLRHDIDVELAKQYKNL
ncbi:MAG: hypothetical protein IK027_05420 [Deltaproteobacteria bacterium]|nr:hypothetical protein [Deltaproteobacteria bacterium]